MTDFGFEVGDLGQATAASESKSDGEFGEQNWGGQDFGYQDLEKETKGDRSGGGGGGGPKTCNNCGKEGHFKRECPDIPEDQRGGGGGGTPGACFNCGETGHNKADCPNPRVFKGSCRVCGKEGHPAKECPDRPVQTCKNCQEEGHVAAECSSSVRKLDFSAVASMTPEEAWKLIEQSSADRDLDDFRDALQIYVKSTPDVTYKQLEQGFRSMGLAFHVVGLDKPVDEIFTLMDLQGRLGMKYTVGFFFSPKCQRKTMQKFWPSGPDENLARLEQAGVPVDRFVMKCSNCGELGHTFKACPQEKREPASAAPEIRCPNCDALGHRMRDCPQPRIDKFACRNCNQRGHDAKECPKPRDWSRVKCNNCGKMGHTKSRCKENKDETNEGSGFGTGLESGEAEWSGGGDFGDTTAGAGTDDSGGGEWGTTSNVNATPDNSGW